MEPFATVEQYAARYGPPEDPELLAEVLMDATRLIAAELEREGVALSEEGAGGRMQACRSVAHRALGDGEVADLPFGVTQYSQTAGPFSASVSVGNAYRDVFLTKAERRMLGLGRARAGFAGPWGEAADG